LTLSMLLSILSYFYSFKVDQRSSVAII